MQRQLWNVYIHVSVGSVPKYEAFAMFISFGRMSAISASDRFLHDQKQEE